MISRSDILSHLEWKSVSAGSFGLQESRLLIGRAKLTKSGVPKLKLSREMVDRRGRFSDKDMATGVGRGVCVFAGHRLTHACMLASNISALPYIFILRFST